MSRTDPPHIKDCFAVADTASASAGNAVVEIDFEKYFEFTKDFDMTEDQQRALLQALHAIMLAFVDMGFDLSPVQDARAPEIACGQSKSGSDESAQTLGDVINSIVSDDKKLTAAFRKNSGSAETQ